MNGEQIPNQPVSDEDKIKQVLYSQAMSRVSLLKAIEIVEEFVIQQIDKQYLSLDQATKDKILQAIKQAESTIITPNNSIIFPK